jgi:hypothetical protein
LLSQRAALHAVFHHGSSPPSPLNAKEIAPTLYEPEEFAALEHADKD